MVKHHAVGIFSLLAEAEGKVHGITPDAVAFHEVGAANSIADIVGAAWLVAALDGPTWSVAPLPLGSGRVRSAHGMLPVPAPATALLLEGFATVDDGIAGERVTPTGAAILRWLDCADRPSRHPMRVGRSGYGFGTKTFPGLANCVRVLAFDLDQSLMTGHRELVVVSFEVDDQSAEDLAMGLDRVRGIDGVHDVLQMAALGKKGRMGLQFRCSLRRRRWTRRSKAASGKPQRSDYGRTWCTGVCSRANRRGRSRRQEASRQVGRPAGRSHRQDGGRGCPAVAGACRTVSGAT